MRRILQFNFNTYRKEYAYVQIYARTWKEAHAAVESSLKINCSYTHFRGYASIGTALLGRDDAKILLGASVTMEEVEKEFPRV